MYRNLSKNNLREFPYQLKSLSSLKELILNDNRISGELNEEIFNFLSLNTLKIWNNKFYGDLTISKNIVVLDADNNNFSSLKFEDNSKLEN
eukprot:jgi/Orpsp1_1/1191507/evm.model.d7180000086449.1